MSAVAPALNDSSVAVPVLGLAKPAKSTHTMHADEQNRWMIWFGTPALIACLFFGVTFGTGDSWWLGVSLAALLADIFVLVWLCMSSDTNGLIGEVAPH